MSARSVGFAGFLEQLGLKPGVYQLSLRRTLLPMAHGAWEATEIGD